MTGTAGPRDPRPFGVAVFLVADGLFFFAALYICLYVRRGVASWPDVAAPLVLSALAPGVAVGSVAAAALARARLKSLLWPLAGAVAALALVAATLLDAASRGLHYGTGRYGTVVWAVSTVWALQVAVAVGILAAALFRGRAPEQARGVGSFLWFLAAAGAVVLGAVFL